MATDVATDVVTDVVTDLVTDVVTDVVRLPVEAGRATEVSGDGFRDGFVP